jgi:parvulin-like peptidyl-prolyl isomerase
MKIFSRIRQGNTLHLSVFLVCVFLLSQCGSKNSSTEAQPSAQEGQPEENRAVLQVGDAVYSEADFNKYVRDAAGNGAKALEIPTLSRLFDEFVEQKLFLQAARNQKVTLSLAEKKEYLAKLAEESWTEEEKATFLESDSGPFFDKMRVEKYIDEVVKDVKVDESEIQRYYDLHKSEFFLPERVKVSQILLPTVDKAIEAWDKAKLVSEEGFRALAMSESIGPEASQGGEMGVFQKGQLPGELGDAIFSLREGEVSPVVESSYGFHIFRLDKKYEPEWIPFEEASSSIKLKILDLKIKAAVSRRLQELKESLEWAVFPWNLSFPYQRTE